MSIAGLATHLGNIPEWSRAILDESSFDLAARPPNLIPRESRADILTAFDESTRRTRALLDKTDAEFLGLWSLRRGDHELFTMPRVAAFRTFVLYHIVHHRGQLSVYLRLNNVPVPAIYGPTADDG